MYVVAASRHWYHRGKGAGREVDAYPLLCSITLDILNW